jgi:hypothetical protein
VTAFLGPRQQPLQPHQRQLTFRLQPCPPLCHLRLLLVHPLALPSKSLAIDFSLKNPCFETEKQ